MSNTWEQDLIEWLNKTFNDYYMILDDCDLHIVKHSSMRENEILPNSFFIKTLEKNFPTIINPMRWGELSIKEPPYTIFVINENFEIYPFDSDIIHTELVGRGGKAL